LPGSRRPFRDESTTEHRFDGITRIKQQDWFG
jgi:hypothetical protein